MVCNRTLIPASVEQLSCKQKEDEWNKQSITNNQKNIEERLKKRLGKEIVLDSPVTKQQDVTHKNTHNKQLKGLNWDDNKNIKNDCIIMLENNEKGLKSENHNGYAGSCRDKTHNIEQVSVQVYEDKEDVSEKGDLEKECLEENEKEADIGAKKHIIEKDSSKPEVYSKYLVVSLSSATTPTGCRRVFKGVHCVMVDTEPVLATNEVSIIQSKLWSSSKQSTAAPCSDGEDSLDGDKNNTNEKEPNQIRNGKGNQRHRSSGSICGGASGGGGGGGDGDGDEDKERKKRTPVDGAPETVGQENDDKDENEKDVSVEEEVVVMKDDGSGDAKPTKKNMEVHKQTSRDHSPVGLEEAQTYLGMVPSSDEQNEIDDAIKEALTNINICLLEVFKSKESIYSCDLCLSVFSMMSHVLECQHPCLQCGQCHQAYLIIKFHVNRCSAVNGVQCSVFCGVVGDQLKGYVHDKGRFLFIAKQWLASALGSSPPCVTSDVVGLTAQFQDMSLRDESRKNEVPVAKRSSLIGSRALGMIDENSPFDTRSVPLVAKGTPSLPTGGQAENLRESAPRSAPYSHHDVLSNFMQSNTDNGAESVGEGVHLSGNAEALRGFMHDTSAREGVFSSGMQHSGTPAPGISLMRNLRGRSGRFASLGSRPRTNSLGNLSQASSHLASLPISYGEGARRGFRSVDYGNLTHLGRLAKQWTYFKAELEKQKGLDDGTSHQGIIFVQFREKIVINSSDQCDSCDLTLTSVSRRIDLYKEETEYRVLSHLGSGTTGQCHLCVDLKSGFLFCRKKVPLAKYKENELLLWSRLAHPGIIQLYGAIRDGEHLYILLEYADGGTLHTLIENHSRLSIRQSLLYHEQILDVLVYLRRKNVLHEDLKAENLLLFSNLRLAVTDFGVSYYLDGEAVTTRGPFGTETHNSPEKMENAGHDYRAEVWAATCNFVHMLTGSPPWKKRYQNRVATLTWVIYQNSPPMEDVPLGLPSDVRNLIEKGWTVDVNERPFAKELLEHEAFGLLQDREYESVKAVSVRYSSQSTADTTEDEDDNESGQSPAQLLSMVMGAMEEEQEKDEHLNYQLPMSLPSGGDLFENNAQPVGSESTVLGIPLTVFNFSDDEDVVENVEGNEDSRENREGEQSMEDTALVNNMSPILPHRGVQSHHRPASLELTGCREKKMERSVSEPVYGTQRIEHEPKKPLSEPPTFHVAVAKKTPKDSGYSTSNKSNFGDFFEAKPNEEPGSNGESVEGCAGSLNDSTEPSKNSGEGNVQSVNPADFKPLVGSPDALDMGPPATSTPRRRSKENIKRAYSRVSGKSMSERADEDYSLIQNDFFREQFNKEESYEKREQLVKLHQHVDSGSLSTMYVGDENQAGSTNKLKSVKSQTPSEIDGVSLEEMEVFHSELLTSSSCQQMKKVLFKLNNEVIAKVAITGPDTAWKEIVERASHNIHSKVGGDFICLYENGGFIARDGFVGSSSVNVIVMPKTDECNWYVHEGRLTSQGGGGHFEMDLDNIDLDKL